jgi:hypothetical protein
MLQRHIKSVTGGATRPCGSSVHEHVLVTLTAQNIVEEDFNEEGDIGGHFFFGTQENVGVSKPSNSLIFVLPRRQLYPVV